MEKQKGDIVGSIFQLECQHMAVRGKVTLSCNHKVDLKNTGSPGENRLVVLAEGNNNHSCHNL
jgi:hypothetical protein